MNKRTNLINNKYSLIIAALFMMAFTPFNELTAQTKKGGSSTLVTGSSTQNLKIDKPKPLLTADHAPIKRDIAIIDSLELEDEFENEELLFPADEIYQGWNNHSVNPYGTTAMPDSFIIDLSAVVMPIDKDRIQINSPFGPRKRRMHKGIDLDIEVGDTIRAVCDGKVRVKRLEGLKRGYGYFLILRHPNGLETVYGHLSKFLVEEDQIVKAGQAIALGGSTGRSTGPHLHFETRFYGVAINPAEMFDFNNQVMHQDTYAFNKNRVPENKYTTKGKNKVAYHRVKSGESLSSIARKHGLSVSQLCKLNNISTKSTIRAGKTLRCS